MKRLALRSLKMGLTLLFFIPFRLGAQQRNVLQLLPQNPHYFLYQNEPTVIVGSGEHYGAVINQDFNYDTYLATLQAARLNTTRLFMGAYFEKPGAFGISNNTLAPPEARLLLPWKKDGAQYDLTAWNDAYFTRLHDFFTKAAAHGVIVEVTLFSAYYGAGWPYHPFNGINNRNNTPTNLPAAKVNTLDNGAILKFQEAYVRKLVTELNHYDNLYFEIQNEPWAESKDTVLTGNDYILQTDLKEPGNHWKNTLEVSSQASNAWHKTVSGWITDAEKELPKKHLISHNNSNFGLPVSATDPRISIYTFHYAKPEAVDWNYTLNKVIGFNETGFAGTKDATYRRQAWRFMMRGGGLFNQLDYSFTTGHEDGTDTTNQAPGGGSTALRASFAILRKVFNELNLATLKPNHAFLHHADGAFAYAMNDATSYLIYLEPMRAAPATLYLTLPKGRYTVTWMDTETGTDLKTETLQITQAKTALITPLRARDTFVKLKRS